MITRIDPGHFRFCANPTERQVSKVWVISIWFYHEFNDRDTEILVSGSLGLVGFSVLECFSSREENDWIPDCSQESSHF